MQRMGEGFVVAGKERIFYLDKCLQEAKVEEVPELGLSTQSTAQGSLNGQYALLSFNIGTA